MALLGFLALSGPCAALAQEAPVGDPARGATLFAETCVACHAIKTAAGEVLVEAESRNGPNLHGVAGATPGGDPEHYYTDMIRAYRDSGAVWGEENFVAFLPDPTAFLRAATGKGGSSRMPHGMVVDAQEAHDLWAYLATFPPRPAAAD
jgi:cytochrome c